ncbi:hypothetical protein DF050_14160 [Burkholderia cepacia]|nr:hypothetical protein DF050_14160 [Burkholderia cepacia]
MSLMFDILKDRYGAVMTLDQLAAALSRKPEGLRMALLKPKSEWARRIGECRANRRDEVVKDECNRFSNICLLKIL